MKYYLLSSCKPTMKTNLSGTGIRGRAHEAEWKIVTGVSAIGSSAAVAVS